MVKIILLRHGYSITNRDGKFTGQTDVPLDELGLRQGEAASEYIFKNYAVDKIYSSDLCRAVDTVRPLADALMLPIEKSADLRELHMGIWEGMYIEDVKTKDAENYNAYKSDPMNNKAGGGETFGDLALRSTGAINKIVSQNDGKTVVIASHGGFIRSFLRAILNPNEKKQDLSVVPNASVSVVNYENGCYTPEIIGYNDYLNEKTGEKKGSMVH